MPRRTLDFPTFDAMLADVETLQARGYQRMGNWTLEQVCEHLTTFMRMSLEGFPETKLTLKMRLARMLRGVILRQMLKSRKMPAGVRGPDAFMPGPKSDPAMIETFKQMCARMRDHAGPCKPSPLFGDLSAEQWRQIHLIHGAHHLSFLVPTRDFTV